MCPLFRLRAGMPDRHAGVWTVWRGRSNHSRRDAGIAGTHAREQQERDQHMKEIRCKDAGVDCDFVAQAETMDELMKKVQEHAQKDHGYKDIPPELVAKVKSLVRDVK